ncbi:HTTM domain-containing protein [Agromyces sp. ISL-38]|uniref:HTTM domain-containing protein n=1 Tax=Agromyces sp. ISL-38 TaxID=2819107 RepID=UPI001BEA01BC|nr:HTTM domain-containing protein [Agromyces sp. ISL-38]MBT2498344.1 HTTM domain-containing protein [Agromyces sp. ISL-38]
MKHVVQTRRPLRSSLAMRLVEWTTGAERATYSLSALRILFGIAIVWFLLASAPDRHYLWGAGSTWVDPAVDRRGYPEIFRTVFPKGDPFVFDLNYGILIALALLFLAGFGTRIVTPFLLVFWVGLSTNSVFLTNGGDVVMRITLLFCVFANLSRHWSLDAWWCRHRGVASIYPSVITRRIPSWVSAAAHNTAVVLCGYQVLLIYVNSGIFKLMGEEWLEGSALYYAFNLDVFRVFPALSDIAWQVTPLVLLGSWISIWAQLLFPVLLVWKPTRYAALIIIMGMHLGIGLFLGLWPFSIAMIALDLVFVRDASWERAFAWAGNAQRAARLTFASRRQQPAVSRTEESQA